MRLILVPGFEEVNEVWSTDINDGFNNYFNKISVINHYDNLGNLISDEMIDKEVKHLVENINLYEDDGYVIFAKTTGILVVLKAISEGKINPKKCIFLHIPVIRARINNLDIDSWLYGHDIDTLFVQTKDDLDFYFDEMSEYLKNQKVENFQLIEVETLNFGLSKIQKYKTFALDYLSNGKQLNFELDVKQEVNQNISNLETNYVNNLIK